MSRSLGVAVIALAATGCAQNPQQAHAPRVSDDERRIAAAEYRRWLRRFEQSIRRSLQEHPGVRDANATLEIGHVVRDGRRDREVLWHLWIDPESRQEFRSEERRVGKAGRAGGGRAQEKERGG